MKRAPLKIAIFLTVLVTVAASAFTLGYSTKLKSADINVLFSPRGGCTAEIIRNIGRADKTIFVQAYSFTSTPIAQALVEAHARGVSIQIILDDSQRSEKYTSATFCSNAGIPTYIDAKHGIAHNKIIIIDGDVVLTGSFNFSKAAEESNAENLVVIRNPRIALLYKNNWHEHRSHAVKYSRKNQ